MDKLHLPLQVSIKELEENEQSPLPLFDAGLNIATGKHTGYSIVNKFGRDTAVNVTNLPSDIWDGGGVYKGFHLGNPEEIEVFSTSPADKGQVVIQYLADWDSEAYKVVPVQLNGTTPVSTGIKGIHVHTARYNNGSETGFNAGAITVKHVGGAGHIFCKMPPGRSQTACAAIRVPANHTGYVVRVFADVFYDRNIVVDGGLWIRDKGESSRLRRPFSCSPAKSFEEKPFGGIPVLAGGDVMLRVLGATLSIEQLQMTGGFDIVFVRNAN